jgi:hypothetical protein
MAIVNRKIVCGPGWPRDKGETLRKIVKAKRAWGWGEGAQGIECLSTKHKALSSNSSTKRKKKTQQVLVVHTCNPSYCGGRSRRITVQDQHKQKSETLSEKLKQKGLGMG